MKIRILILSIICISVGSKFYSCISKPERSPKFEAIFIADSGFIDKYSLVYLFPNIDTADFKYYNFDKAGKYYKDYRSAKYIVLIYNPNKEE